VREGDQGKKSYHYLKEQNGTEWNGMEHTQTSVYIIRNKGTEQKGNEQNGVNWIRME
jgi:hypothetical protein